MSEAKDMELVGVVERIEEPPLREQAAAGLRSCAERLSRPDITEMHVYVVSVELRYWANRLKFAGGDAL